MNRPRRDYNASTSSPVSLPHTRGSFLRGPPYPWVFRSGSLLFWQCHSVPHPTSAGSLQPLSSSFGGSDQLLRSSLGFLVSSSTLVCWSPGFASAHRPVGSSLPLLYLGRHLPQSSSTLALPWPLLTMALPWPPGPSSSPILFVFLVLPGSHLSRLHLCRSGFWLLPPLAFAGSLSGFSLCWLHFGVSLCRLLQGLFCLWFFVHHHSPLPPSSVGHLQSEDESFGRGELCNVQFGFCFKFHGLLVCNSLFSVFPFCFIGCHGDSLFDLFTCS